jgi:hypothetical protein
MPIERASESCARRVGSRRCCCERILTDGKAASIIEIERAGGETNLGESPEKCTRMQPPGQRRVADCLLGSKIERKERSGPSLPLPLLLLAHT